METPRPGPSKRPERVPVRAHLFLEPNALCVVDEDQLGRLDGAGQAIASRVAGADPTRPTSTLALAWAQSYRDDTAPEFDLDPSEEPESAPDFVDFEGSGPAREEARRPKRPPKRERPPKEEPRQLHDVDELDLGQLGAFC